MAVDHKSDPKFQKGDRVFVLSDAYREDYDSNDPMQHLDLTNYKKAVGVVEKLIELGDGMRGNKWYYKVKFNFDKNATPEGRKYGRKMSNISYLVLKEDELYHDNDVARLLYGG